jgi:hypothetical protein
MKIAELTQLIRRLIHQEFNHSGTFCEDDLPRINKNAIPLTQALLPIIKLSRLFFKMLARDGLNKAPLKSFTDMNSYQLATLSQLPELIF